GNDVHQWPYVGFPSGLIDPKLAGGQRGHVLVQYATSAGSATAAVPGQPALFRNKTIAELDWSGSVVWQWGDKAPGGSARQHHDWERLPNGDTLVLANLSHPVNGFSVPVLLDDVIYEVAPNGNVVWSWVASEHLDQLGFTPEELKLVRQTPNPDYLHVNDMTALGPNKWYRAGDKRFNPDNILFDSRNANFVAIIDKSTGNIVWRIGPNYPVSKAHAVPGPVDQLSGQHDARLIPDGLPGAGNLLLFDNQGPAGYPPAILTVNGGSRVLEIDPVAKSIVWRYTAGDSNGPGWDFYSSFISSAQRLPNGNTLVDEGMNGRFFQVTPAGEIVWEYVSPYFGTSLTGAGPHPVTSNSVYRAQPVPYDWVPEGIPHAERAIVPPDVATFRVPGAP
ncbi:MAG TPA: aryl-sulfate sulfotransferase, partial [Candidatus Baltobacteraceae bacterium]